MTINDLRKQYPNSKFYFFENGYAYRSTPWLYQKIKSYKEGATALFIEL